MKNINSNTESAQSFTLFYTNEQNDDIAVKTCKKVNKVKLTTLEFVADKANLEKIGATQVYVLDNCEDELYVCVKNEDGSWEELLNDFEKGVDEEVKNILLNKVFYSLTHLLPENFKSRAPELCSSIISNKKGIYPDPCDDFCGWVFQNGDAIIRMTLCKSSREEKREWVKKVAEHFDVKLSPFGENAYEIVIPDQEKYFKAA